MEYTTIKKQVGIYDVLMTDDPTVLPRAGRENAQFKNLLVCYCEHNGKFASFLMSKQILKDESSLYVFLTNNINHILAQIA